MKTLTIRRWLVVAWLVYFFSSVALFAIISVFVWRFAGWHNSTPQENFSNGVFPFVLYPAVFVLTQLITAGAISWFVGKAVLKPLAAMSQAARQIARGDLNFSLPSSQVREVAEVAGAFDEMGKALQTALGRQSELEQGRRLFISAVAHDLRTPLFSLRGYLEGLERGIAATPEKVAHYLAVCQEKAADLEKRIHDLFAYARLEYMEQAPRRDKVELGLLLNKIIESFRPLLEAKQIEVKLESSQAAYWLEGDELLLTRMFENLLDNAIRFAPKNGTIWLGWHTQAGQCYFTVADNGCGLVAQDLPHLFEPLYRGELSRSRQTGGAGLGLTIARRILLAHGGGLEAANRAEGGAEFTGWLNLSSA